MLIKEKKIKTEKGKCKITLESDGFQYIVKVDGKELFAVQTFNAI